MKDPWKGDHKLYKFIYISTSLKIVHRIRDCLIHDNLLYLNVNELSHE